MRIGRSGLFGGGLRLGRRFRGCGGVFDFGIRFAWQILRGGIVVGFGAPFQEHGEGSGKLTVVADFVAVEEVDGRGGSAAEVLQGEGGLGGRVSLFGGIGAGVVDFGDGMFEGGGLHGEDAEGAPAGDGHVFDEGAGEVVGGLEGGFEGREEGFEGRGVFEGEDDVAGQEAVARGVLGRAALPFFGLGSVRFGSVGLGGSDAAFG